MEMQEIMEKYKNQLLNAIVILLALFVAFKIYSNQAQNVANIKAQKDNETKKLGIFKEIQESQEKLKIYKDYINQKDLSSVINIVTDIAKQASVDIISVRPAQEDPKEFYTRYPLNVIVAAENYHNLADFIAKLESDPSIFSVEELRVVTSSLSEDGSETLKADLRVSTVLSKDGDS